MNCKVGDRVLLPEYGGTPFKMGDEEYTLFCDCDILGKFEYSCLFGTIQGSQHGIWEKGCPSHLIISCSLSTSFPRFFPSQKLEQGWVQLFQTHILESQILLRLVSAITLTTHFLLQLSPFETFVLQYEPFGDEDETKGRLWEV